MALENHQLHFVLVPLMAAGHFIPMLDMAKLLAQNGVTVTVITPPLIASRFTPTINRAAKSGLRLRLLSIRFPNVEAGLPEGCETADAVPSVDLFKNFSMAIGMLQEPFEQLFESLEPTPSCLIADKNVIFLSETARKFGVPRIIFDGMSCFSVLISNNLHVSKAYENVLDDSTRFLVPNLPDKIELTRAQLPGLFNPGSANVQSFRQQIRDAETEAYGVVVNSFEELEPRYVNELRTVKRNQKVWCIGPLSLCSKDNSDKFQRGYKASIDENQCLEWLDKHKTGSVVFVCLGSLTRMTSSQLIELGMGLEASKRPFVWVVTRGDKTNDVEKWMVENGFGERNKGRCLVIRGWAPQVLILSHQAVGAFLTHCGWNSTLEGVCAGIPMITWPMFGEQFLNEKLIVQVLEIGVGVGAPFVVQLCEEGKYGVLVKCGDVMEAVERVMSEGNEGEERRERARVLGDMAKRAMEEGGSSYLNVKLLIEDIRQQVKHKSKASTL